jgi:hypothetical protein
VVPSGATAADTNASVENDLYYDARELGTCNGENDPRDIRIGFFLHAFKVFGARSQWVRGY